MQTKDALLTERSSDLRVMQTKCESMRDQVEALNIRIAVADEKLAAATKSKKLLTVIATVGGLFASKGWSMLDKPGLENVGWGLIVIGALCASAAIIYPWLGRNK